uniref:Auxin-responsive protein n=1 Tax=Kalanchoe fedtschenkoi TaxID=63787 RepID=A0A7N0U0I7_KALFE
MESSVTNETDLNLEATELRLGLPGTEKEPVKDLSLGLRVNKRASLEMLSSSEDSRVNSNSTASDAGNGGRDASPPSKAQVVGWPPIRSYRKNNLQVKKSDGEGGGMYVKVSMDGAPYLRKIDLKVYKTYAELLKGLEEMFKFTIGEYSEREGYNGSEYVPTYEDKDGDWMLVGDVPWEMFISTCKRLRVMKGSEAKGLCCV